MNESLEALKTKLGAETDEVIREKFQELLASIQANNEKAKQHLEDTLNKTQTIGHALLRDTRIQSAKNAYRGIVQFNLKVIENFQQRYSL